MTLPKPLVEQIIAIENPTYRSAVFDYLEDITDLTTSPASRFRHHAHKGGLVLHMIDVSIMAQNIVESNQLQPWVNMDHVIMAALLHDVGKVKRYKYNEEEHRWEYKNPERRAATMHEYRPIFDFYKVTKVMLPDQVKIAILSHMGGWSKTGVYPDDVLSAVIHAADLITSRIGQTS